MIGVRVEATARGLPQGAMGDAALMTIRAPGLRAAVGLRDNPARKSDS